MARRRIIFDIDELASVAAKSVGANRCVDIEKCPDGLYNKAYVLTMDDGKQVIGKVPDPNAGIPHYTTASEVATMDFVGRSLIYYYYLSTGGIIVQINPELHCQARNVLKLPHHMCMRGTLG